MIQYDPFADIDDDGKRAWHLFILWLAQQCGFEPIAASDHVDWLLRKEFQTPAEWLGEEGERWRVQIGMQPKFPEKTLRAWEAFSAEHGDKLLSDIEAMLATEARP